MPQVPMTIAGQAHHGPPCFAFLQHFLARLKYKLYLCPRKHINKDGYGNNKKKKNA